MSLLSVLENGSEGRLQRSITWEACSFFLFLDAFRRIWANDMNDNSMILMMIMIMILMMMIIILIIILIMIITMMIMIIIINHNNKSFHILAFDSRCPASKLQIGL